MLQRAGVAIAALTISLSTATLAEGQTDPNLDKLAADFEVAFNAKDAAKVAAFYAEDAVVMPPNEPMIKGRAAIQAYWAKQFQQGIDAVDLQPMQSRIDGQRAFEAGAAVLKIKLGNSETVSERAKYVVVYKRVGTEWKLAFDIFNSDSPPTQ